MVSNDNSQVIFEINPKFAVNFPPSDFLSLHSLFFLEMDRRCFDGELHLFHVRSPDFNFSAVVHPGGVTLIRQSYELTFPIKDIDFSRHNGHCKLAFLWDWLAQKMSINVNGSSVEMDVFCDPAPITLFAWLREQSMMPSERFSSTEEMAVQINNVLDGIGAKILGAGAYKAYWDVGYGSNGRIVSRRPKRETDVQGNLASLIMDQMVQKNVTISLEYQTGVGPVDIALHGQIEGANLPGRHLIEFKNSHSSSLVHGLVEQLPAYMEASQAHFGTYCVLCYHGEWFSTPGTDVTSTLNRLMDESGGQYKDRISIVGIALGKPVSASKR